MQKRGQKDKKTLLYSHLINCSVGKYSTFLIDNCKKNNK